MSLSVSWKCYAVEGSAVESGGRRIRSTEPNETLLPSGAREASFCAMVDPVNISSYRDDTLWAVVASIGRTSRVAEVFSSRLAALADQAWREQQVNAYANFLRNSRQPTPSYSVKPIRRADLPRSWRPLPALGFLQGKLL